MTRPLDVLVVDDEFLIRWAVARTLAEAGHCVREACDAESAIAALMGGARPPDVVLLDYRLPGTRGLELLGAVRQLSPTSTVVMMSADSHAWTTDAARMGASAVIPKPFDMEAIEAALLAAHVAHSPVARGEGHLP
jgi:two-component system nitrogen regulation response regulator GlnG